jgi:glycosyltransferase involved in cell wall biosynthesis
MRIINVLHHSISPFAGMFPEGDPLHYNSGIPMEYARAIQKRYKDIDLEVWRPERTCPRLTVWRDSDGITHRIFPSLYMRYGFEFSREMLNAIALLKRSGDVFVWLHGLYNLHSTLLAPVLQKIPSIAQSHGGLPAPLMVEMSKHRLNRFAYWGWYLPEHYAFRRYTRVHAISTMEQTALQHYYPGSVVTLRPAGTDFKVFSPLPRISARKQLGLKPDDLVVFFAGRLTEGKGIVTLVQAIETVKIASPGIKLYIAGDGPAREVVKLLISSLHLEGNTELLGHVSHDTLPTWYSAVDVTAMPSGHEWFGRVAVESMACGTPVITTNAGGAIDIVKTFKCGVLVQPDNVAQLAAGITSVLEKRVNVIPDVASGRVEYDWDSILSSSLASLSKYKR